MLPNPLRDRFGFTANMEFYSDDELSRVLARATEQLGVTATAQALGEISSRSRGTPRIANRLLRRVRDYALVSGSSEITNELTKAALELYEVDRLGLDRLDRSLLETLGIKFEMKPVGLSTLAAAIGEEADTIESVVEPFLVRQGLISRTAKGRVITAAGLRHIGVQPTIAE
jgi:Holliday junction DNA helicase RuvB